MIKLENWFLKIGKYSISEYDPITLWIYCPGEQGFQILEKDFENILSELQTKNTIKEPIR